MAAPAPYVVQAGVWLDGMTPYSQGAYWVKPRTVVMIVPNSALAARYGGMSNLAPLPLIQQGAGDAADHSHIGN